jgi:hypothetical protein
MLILWSFLGISIALWTFFGVALERAVSPAQILSIPLSSVDIRTMLRASSQSNADKDFIKAILIANMPQLVLSATYSVFNRAITTFALCKEVREFSIRKKGLRVSTVPRGAQRSEYFLQLPYRFALPAMLFSGVLHWLCSQCFYLVSIVVETPTLHDTEENLSWGYSPQAILILALLILLMYAMLIGFGSRRFRSEMPTSGTCSAVISAMCHQPADEDGDKAVLKPVSWGVSSEVECDGLRVVETSFSSRVIRLPTDEDSIITL